MKKKLFELLLERGLVSTEAEARSEIMAGNVFSKGERLDKAGQLVDVCSEFTLKQKEHPYVSRGGLKLVGALETFDVDVSGMRCIDIGSSTGGFTDCLLQHGARSVTAVDVGVGELAWKLRTDSRVEVREGVNARNLTLADFSEQFDIAVCDVSFISLKHIFPLIKSCLRSDGTGIVLIKPQFEARREQVGEGGIVRDAAIHREVVERVCGYATEIGLRIERTCESPIKGMKGNVEFLALVTHCET